MCVLEIPTIISKKKKKIKRPRGSPKGSVEIDLGENVSRNNEIG